MNDALLLFDHHHDRLVRFRPDGFPSDSCSISYHHSRIGKWSGRLYVDRLRQTVYTSYVNGGKTKVEEINPETGKCISSAVLAYPYVQQLAIQNGWAYYIYRPFASSQNRYIYRERLKNKPLL